MGSSLSAWGLRHYVTCFEGLLSAANFLEGVEGVASSAILFQVQLQSLVELETLPHRKSFQMSHSALDKRRSMDLGCAWVANFRCAGLRVWLQPQLQESHRTSTVASTQPPVVQRLLRFLAFGCRSYLIPGCGCMGCITMALWLLTWCGTLNDTHYIHKTQFAW